MAEKIQYERLAICQQWKCGRPKFRSLLAAHRFAAFRLQKLQTDSLDVGSQIERLHIKRKRGKAQRLAGARAVSGAAHSSFSSSGNLARNSDDCLRTSTQSKKASGFSSQTRNQLAISSFSSRLCASTLWLRAIISARRLPSRAICSTRSAAAFSSCARNRRSSSSRRIKLTSASLKVLKCSKSSNS